MTEMSKEEVLVVARRCVKMVMMMGHFRSRLVSLGCACFFHVLMVERCLGMALRRFLFGVDSLLGKGNKKVSIDTIENKVVLLFFGAEWCPSCATFTPILINLYTKLRKGAVDKVEIIYISSDKTQENFDVYFGSHPWLALPWELRDCKRKIALKLKIQCIPTLVILDEACNILSKNGRSLVLQDPEGSNFPWIPRNVWKILEQASFICGTGAPSSITTAEMKKNDNGIALYFSAMWSPPCRYFTPRLGDIYRKLKARGVRFELIFVSLDQSEQDYLEYLSEMPWIALSFGDHRVRELCDALSIVSIPSLVTLDSSGAIINTDALSVVDDDETAELYPWWPHQHELSAMSLTPSRRVTDALDNGVCVLLSVNGASNGPVVAAEFDTAVREYAQYRQQDSQPVFFFHVDETQDLQWALYCRILSSFGLDRPKRGSPSVLLMNALDRRDVRFVQGELSSSNIISTIRDFTNG